MLGSEYRLVLWSVVLLCRADRTDGSVIQRRLGSNSPCHPDAKAGDPASRTYLQGSDPGSSELGQKSNRETSPIPVVLRDQESGCGTEHVGKR